MTKASQKKWKVAWTLYEVNKYAQVASITLEMYGQQREQYIMSPPPNRSPLLVLFF